jgi:periplasmic protein TonB
MFEGLQFTPVDAERRRRWVASGVIAALFYGAVGAGVALFATSPPPVPDRDLEVSFEKPVKKEAAPSAAPSPPPPPPAAPARQPRVTPIKPARPITVPKEVPKEAPPEADPASAAPSGSAGDEHGVLGGTGPVGEAPAPPPPPPPPPPKASGPINLPEGATAPVASRDNAMPEYPESERKTGREGQVILKVVVTESGRVTSIQVLRGEEPFVAAALAAVKSWSYSPAMHDGRPIAVYRILNIPFRMSGGYQEKR